MAQLRANVPAPPARPPRYGLIAAAPTIDDTDMRWPGGFSFTPEQCAGGGRASVTCGGSTAALDVGLNPGLVNGDPFAVFAGDRCSSFGFEARDYVGRARRQLAAIESFEIANELWTGSLSAAEGLDNRALTDLGSDTLTAGAASPIDAISCIEQGLAVLLRGRQGMIHMTPQLLAHLVGPLGVISREGQVYTSPMGHIVVADAGYDGSAPGGAAAGASQWIYGTSIVQVRLGPVDVIPERFELAVDHSVNNVEYIAERLAAIQWEPCGHVAAEVNIAACAVGGAA